MITVRELLELDTFQRANLEAGRSGLDRTVAWFCIMDIPDVWVAAGELVLTSGYAWPTPPTERAAFLRELDQAGASGIVLAKGRYVPTIDPEVRETADQLAIPLISVPYSTRFSELTRSLEGEIRQAREYMRRLLQGEEDPGKRLDSGQKLGLDDDSSYLVVILSGLSEGKPVARGSNVGLTLKRRLYTSVQRFFTRREYQHFIWEDFLRLITVIEVPDAGVRKKSADLPIMQTLYRELCSQLSADDFFLAVGHVHRGLGGISRSYEEANAAFTLGEPAEGIVGYERSEIARILMSTHNAELVSNYHLRTLGLVKEQLPELYETLIALIANHFNKRNTCLALRVHKNTLLYRIRRIEDHLDMDLGNPRVQFELQLAAEIERLRNRGML